MRICVVEDACVLDLYPLSLTRPAFDLRCGTGTLLDRQRRYFAGGEFAVRVRPGLVDLTRLAHPDVPVNTGAWMHRGGAAVLVNARWLAPADSPPFPPAGIGLVGDRIAWVVTPVADFDAWSGALSRAWDGHEPSGGCRQVGGALIDHPWQLVEQNGAAIRADFPIWARRPATGGFPGVTVLGSVEQLFVDPAARVEPHVVLDATRGPIVIDRGAAVEAFSRLEGPCYIGPKSQVLGAKIRSGTSLGKGCRVGGEVEASIFHGFVNKYHDGFVGHSYVGAWVNFGAGTQVSDLRNDYAPISVFLRGEKVQTGLVKVGAFLGDFTRTSIGALLNSGTVVGPFGQMVANGGLLPRAVPPFCRIEHGRLREQGDPWQLVDAAGKAVGRRNKEWSESHVEFYFKLYANWEAERRQAIRESEQRQLSRAI
jgi:UDP-N-acetylglucosamine diphosphorylase / glucose-1-phosphate thymidylyltransferase / UDP-N-acetylgalactosamine diphosphorylase / glucosamine-1-phosphate N-acetyltransferase / galactosamine-1-phosphate N-acetyltransferase